MLSCVLQHLPGPSLPQWGLHDSPSFPAPQRPPERQECDLQRVKPPLRLCVQPGTSSHAPALMPVHPCVAGAQPVAFSAAACVLTHDDEHTWPCTCANGHLSPQSTPDIKLMSSTTQHAAYRRHATKVPSATTRTTTAPAADLVSDSVPAGQLVNRLHFSGRTDPA